MLDLQRFGLTLETRRTMVRPVSLPLVTDQIKKGIRRSFSEPFVWVLAGTTLPPMNVLWAIGFWIFASFRKSKSLSGCARCLNIQLTYTFLLGLPFLVGEWISRFPALKGLVPAGSNNSVIVGVSLGLISAVGVLLLVFFNTRAVAQSILEHPPSKPFRVRFVRE